ncbi:MAG: DUF3618 domain-containing protein [Actinomycetaceae bacterium]|nr:DUF3618 domain-containing protein [Actinomycetaceae bacterium]MDY5854872.1 DUF3618 domain-containing protein [Arcanobacterium sp.]
MSERMNPAVNAAARAAAQAKKAIDYESPRDGSDTRSMADIERDIARVREELTATVDELAGRLSPDRLKEDVVASAKAKVESGKEKVQTLVSEAQAGDGKAIGILVGGAVLAAFLLVKIIKR